MKRLDLTLVSMLVGWLVLRAVHCDSETTTDPVLSDPVQLPMRVLDCWPRWCPSDSTKIGFTHGPKDYDELVEHGRCSIWTVDITTCTSECVAPGLLADWSPDGEVMLADSLVLFSKEGARIGNIPYDLEYGYPSHPRWNPAGETPGYIEVVDLPPAGSVPGSIALSQETTITVIRDFRCVCQ